MEAEADLAVELSRIVEMESAEGERIVEQDAAVGDIGCSNGGGNVLAEALSEGEVKGRVLGKVSVGIAGIGGRPGGIVATVGESGAVVDVGGGGDGMGEGGVEADVEGVALIVIDGV